MTTHTPQDQAGGETAPRVSILIPNYNNGRQSSRDGNRDLIGDLLESLERTLANEPVPFEILVFDDGSTDDSIDTLRHWATSKTWKATGRPFLTLMEAPHCGILSITANHLSRAARGDILCRLDGDVVCLTPNWVSRITQAFDEGPERLGVIGPMQLRVDGRVHAFGDWLLHPKGYHHIGHLMDPGRINRPMEVDHVMGCFYCCRKQVYEELGGYDESYLRGQTVDFGMRARLAGWRCWAIPNVEYIHAHSERRQRSTEADTTGGTASSMGTFEQKWGFHRVAPDLDEVRRLYAGTPLLWNPRWLSELDHTIDEDGPVGGRARTEPLTPELSDWGRFAAGQDAAFRKSVETRLGAVFDVVRQAGRPKRLLVYESGHGLLCHMLAKNGLTCVGVDRRADHVEFARAITESQSYEAGSVSFVHQADRRTLPADSGSVDLMLISDALECHPNPAAVLTEARRILPPGGLLIIVSQRVAPHVDPPRPDRHPYLINELAMQFMGVGGFELVIDPGRDDSSRDIVLVGRRVSTQVGTTSPRETARSPVVRNEPAQTDCEMMQAGALT
ncbi:MAG: methyltransferase domain-containing protein [Planctomycetes bacterium]|nr:methyltransferase domain-containing protein [Planctomycetota bacterium]